MKHALLSITVAVGTLGLSAQGAASEATKYFCVAEVDGAWWFVAPDGKLFFSSGVNVVQPGVDRADYSPARPAYAAFRHYSDTAAWARKANDRLAKWGFNTIGGWAAPQVTAGPTPYTGTLHLGAELGVPWNDLLHPRFADQVDALVNLQVKPRAGDPLLIGWFSDNELAWFPDTLLAFHIAQPAESVTRQALVRLLREHYADDFARLKVDFQPVDAANFDELDRGGKLLLRRGGRGMIVADRFTKLFAEHYYRVVGDAIRRYDPHHLVLGDRYHGYCPDAVAEAAGPYVDVISTNFDQPDWTDGQLPAFYLERLHELTGRPVLVTEYYAAARDNRSANKNTGNIFTTVDTQQERAEAVRTRLSSFASLPYVVGAHWFQFSDEPTHGRSDGEDYNFGLVDIEDRPYEELVAAFTDTNAAAPRLHAAAGLSPAKKKGGPLAVPAAPVEPLAGIAGWDQQRATVSSVEKSSLGDLLVSCGPDRMYLALSCNNFVDAAAYASKREAMRDGLIWQITLGERPPLRVSFGVGDELTVSDPEVKSRVHRHGLRYTVILGIPQERIDSQSQRKGDLVQLAAFVEDARRGTRTTWRAQLDDDGILREALSQPDVQPH
jgi:hypothetical protein